MHGKGTYQFPDGTKFEGFYHMGERHGKGIVHFNNQQFYKSNWVLGIDSTGNREKENTNKNYVERKSKLIDPKLIMKLTPNSMNSLNSFSNLRSNSAL